MKYHIIEKENRNARAELKAYTFDELKDYFEPATDFGEELHDKWDEISDVDDLREFLEYEADGMRVDYTIESEPSDEEVLLADGNSKDEVKKLIAAGTTIYSDLEENLARYCNEDFSDLNDPEFIEGIKKMVGDKVPMQDWGIAEIDGKNYYIQYAL